MESLIASLANVKTTLVGFIGGAALWIMGTGLKWPSTKDEWLYAIAGIIVAGLGLVSKDATTGSRPRMILIPLVAALAMGGCILGPSAEQLKALADNDRSWCLSVTSVYGTMRTGGSGIQGGTMQCTQEGMKINDREGAPAPAKAK